MDNPLVEKKILVTGSNSRFAAALKKNFNGPNIIYTDRKKLDILNIKSIDRCLDKYKPKYLMHLASLSRPMIIHEEDINSSIDANIIGTANIVKKCSDRNIKLIYFSTNYVYPGNKGNYDEKDALNPVNNYAWSKLGGEASVKLYKNSLILRLAMTEYPFIHDRAFTDAKTNFIYREEVIKILPYLLNEKGIINIGSDITESFYSFAKKTKKNVKPASVKNVQNFPLNSSVKIQKLKRILKKNKITVTDRKNINNLIDKKKEVYLTSGPSVTQIEREIVDDMMRFGWDNSQYIKKFEDDFAKYHKRKYCILTPSVGIAFQLGIMSANLKKNSRIIIPDFSNANFLNQIIQLKFKPVLAKLNTEKFSIDIKYLKKLLNNNVKGIFCPSFFGNIPDYSELKKILKEKKVFLFEDASDALGKKFKNNYAGKFGDISFHDFSRDKVITCGEGGAILTDKKWVYSKIIKLINNKEISFNSKDSEVNLKSYFEPSNLQAAMLCGQFKRITNLKNKNYMIFKEYQKHFKNRSISIMGYRLIVISFDKKYKFQIESLMRFLNKHKIYCKRLQKPFSKLKYFKNKFQNSNHIYENSLILPSHYNLNSADIEYICNKIKFFIKKI